MTLGSKYQYPSQANQPYKVQAVGSVDWRDFDTMRLEISVGAEYHEGDKFQSAVQWAKGRFENVVIHVVDTLQRHSMAFENKCSIRESYRISKRKGDEWLKRNQSSLGLLSGNPKIFRWDDWKQHPDFAHNRQVLGKLYRENEEFVLAVNQKIDSFWDRKQSSLPQIYTQERRSEFNQSALDYCLEELAGAGCFYKEVSGITGYPGSFEGVWDLLANGNLQNIPESLNGIKWTRLKFNRNTSLKKLELVS